MTIRNFPQHNKARVVHETSRQIGYFLDWLRDNQGIELCKWGENPGEYRPVPDTFEELLFDYFEIDKEAFDQEKEDMLEDQRLLNKQLGIG